MMHCVTGLNGCWRYTPCRQQMPCNWPPPYSGAEEQPPATNLSPSAKDCARRHIGKGLLCCRRGFEYSEQLQHLIFIYRTLIFVYMALEC